MSRKTQIAAAALAAVLLGAFFLVSCVWAASASDPEPSPYISRVSLPDGATMRIGKGEINSIAYSPDSRRIAAASSIGVWIYDAGFGKEIALLGGHTSGFSSAAYSPDGKRIVSTSSTWDDTIRVWDAASNRAEDALLYTLPQNARTAAYSPDGKTIASGGSDNAIRLWNADDGALLNTLEGHTYTVRSVAYSPDGKRIVSGSLDGTARIWDAESGDLLRVLEGHKRDVRSVAYSPNGKRIVSGSMDGTARIWSSDTGGLLHILDKESKTGWGKVYSVAYSMDGRLIACGGYYGGLIEIRMWNANGSPRRPFELNVGPNYVAFSPDGHSLAAGHHRGIYIWNIEIGERVHTISGHNNNAYYTMFTPDGKGFAAAGSSEPLRIWDLETGELLKRFLPAGGQCGAFSPDGNLVAIASLGMIHIVDVETASRNLLRTGLDINALAFSPDGKTLVSSSSDATIRIWNVSTGALLKAFKGHTKGVNSAAYSPDGKTIVSAGANKTVRIWNAATGALLNTLEGHTRDVNSAAYSPDSKTIVSAGNDSAVRIWNAESGAPLHTLEGHRGDVNSAAYSPDGNTVASGNDDNTVRIWNAETGALLNTLEGHMGSVRWVGYSSDGKTLASASDDGTVLIWDVSNLMGSGGEAPEGDGMN